MVKMFYWPMARANLAQIHLLLLHPKKNAVDVPDVGGQAVIIKRVFVPNYVHTARIFLMLDLMDAKNYVTHAKDRTMALFIPAFPITPKHIVKHVAIIWGKMEVVIIIIPVKEEPNFDQKAQAIICFAPHAIIPIKWKWPDTKNTTKCVPPVPHHPDFLQIITVTAVIAMKHQLLKHKKKKKVV